MSKLGIITFHFAENYGAVLQCVALSRALEKIGHDVYVIDYRPKYHTKKYSLWRHTSKNNIGKAKIKQTVSNFINFPSRFKRKVKYKKFINQHLKFTNKYTSIDDLKKNPPEMDCYISGSDQIWNKSILNGKFDDAYLLDFGDENIKKYTYAASMGIVGEDEDINYICEKLKKFTAIGIREKSLYNHMKQYCADNLVITLDPVFLCNRNEWELIESKIKIEEPYILCYYLGQEETINNIAQEIYKKTGHKIINISAGRTRIDNVWKGYKSCSPDEFLAYIHHAEIIITNSFHATAFSIIYKKAFVCVPHSQTYSRMYDLLDAFNLKTRLYDSEQDCSFYLTSPKYDKSEKKFDDLIQDSKHFISFIQ